MGLHRDGLPAVWARCLALYEIKHDDDVPEKVAINEAVELAKKFGGDDSPAFINGILAKLV